VTMQRHPRVLWEMEMRPREDTATSQGSQGNTLSCQLAKWKWNKTQHDVQSSGSMGASQKLSGEFSVAFLF